MDYARFDYPENGYDCDKESNKVLKIGQMYELDSVMMGQSHTTITLKGIKGGFNSVNFSFWTNDTESGELKKFHLQEREEYNPYYYIFSWDKVKQSMNNFEEEYE